MPPGSSSRSSASEMLVSPLKTFARWWVDCRLAVAPKSDPCPLARYVPTGWGAGPEIHHIVTDPDVPQLRKAWIAAPHYGHLGAEYLRERHRRHTMNSTSKPAPRSPHNQTCASRPTHRNTQRIPVPPQMHPLSENRLRAPDLDIGDPVPS